jgi:conjugative relaxase-like TrwC/TraI family protein
MPLVSARRGKGGTSIEPADLVFAIFDHRTSRNLNPTMHAHSLLLNVGMRRDGSSREIFEVRRKYQL